MLFSGVGADWKGGENLDPFTESEFEKRKNETDPYHWITNNCKEKANKLIKDAVKGKKGKLK